MDSFPSAEIPLTGGNMEPVVRSGGTVRRVAGPWSPAVHALLGCFADAGITQTPRALGFDERGREVLSYIPGAVLTHAPPAVAWSIDMVRSTARLLRLLHDASAPLVTQDLRWRQDSHPPVEVICHNDFAPYNLIVDGGELVGVIDHDMASPGSRLWDFAYLAYRIVPFVEDAHAYNPLIHGSRDERLAALITAYGIHFDTDDVLAMIVRRLEALAQFTDERATETGNSDFVDHAAMYRRDADQLR